MSEVRFELLHRDGTRHLSAPMPDTVRALPIVTTLAKAIGSRVLYAVRVKPARRFKVEDTRPGPSVTFTTVPVLAPVQRDEFFAPRNITLEGVDLGKVDDMTLRVGADTETPRRWGRRPADR